MGQTPMEISRETYDLADNETKNGMMFDLLLSLNGKYDKHMTVCMDRFGSIEGRCDKLEKRKKIDAAMSAGGGVVGGFIGFFINMFSSGK
jgi:hypothetical protein